MTAVDVDALEAAREAATAGPWEVSVESDGVWLSAPDEEWPGEIYGERRQEDAALIVAAVNALEPLLAEVRRGRALREAVEGLAGDLLRPVDYEVTHYRDGLRDAGKQIRAVVAALDAS